MSLRDQVFAHTRILAKEIGDHVELTFTHPVLEPVTCKVSLKEATSPDEIALFPVDFQRSRWIGETLEGDPVPESLAKANHLGGRLEVHAVRQVNQATGGTKLLLGWYR